MRTSFHRQPEAQHPNFPLSTSWQADYPIYLFAFGGKADLALMTLPIQEVRIQEQRAGLVKRRSIMRIMARRTKAARMVEHGARWSLRHRNRCR